MPFALIWTLQLGSTKENMRAIDHRLSLPLASFIMAISLTTTTTLTSSSERGNNATVANIRLVTAITETMAPNQTYTTAMSTPSNVTVDGALSTTSYHNSSQNSTGATTHNAVQDNSTTTTALAESSNTTTESTPSALAPTANATSAAITVPGFGLDNSEKGMTVFFSVVLGVFVLGIFMYMLNRWNQMRQYSHRPLYNNSEAEVGGSLAADDTLVISGGLYDGSQIYNPTMTTTDMTEDEFNFDNRLHVSQRSQFRLEFLTEERENSPGYEASTFHTFQPIDDDF
ncbi:sialomucin core protein 24-like isoform X3 [Oncorhynchus mykiss]|uniref:sialomucin core protein 24-like isoform X3 n=1 Tax=Oncorhynchus mykiss TaxID=8022 RepID=UPI0018777BFC|nr:sialomucin core protein 24-like isoform X3 [Oncorhynchus mykiss]